MSTYQKIISCLLGISWTCLIFFMFGMNTNEFNNKSKSTINTLVENIVETTNNVEITNKHSSKIKMNQVINKLNVPLRKVACVIESL